MVDFPSELISLIARDSDRFTLKNCALVDRKWNSAVQEPLWQNIVVDITRIDKSLLETLRDKSPFVRHISFRQYRDASDKSPLTGITAATAAQIFMGAFPNLNSVRIDGRLDRLVWDTALKPTVRALRLWPMRGNPAEALSNFDGLTQLQMLEIGGLWPQGARRLGEAVRKCTLKVLHIQSAKVDGVLAAFFAGLMRASPGNYSETAETDGFPLSLTELAVQDSCKS